MTAVRPSLTSSPVRLSSFSLRTLRALAKSLMALRHRLAEALLVGAALVGVDVVGEAEHRLGVTTRPLHGHLDLGLVGDVLEEGDLAVDRLPLGVEMLDEVDEAARVLEGNLFDGSSPRRSWMRNSTPLLRNAISRTRLWITLMSNSVVSSKMSGSGQNRNVLPVRFAGLPFFSFAVGAPYCERLAPLEAVTGDLDVEPGRQGVDHRDADTMQTTRHRVGALLELASCMEHGEHRRQRGELRLLVPVDGHATPVVLDFRRAVLVEGEIDPVAEAGHGFVDGVVEHLPDEVMQALGAGRPYVHRGTFADCFQTLQNGDVLGAVGRVGRQSWLAQRDS